MEDRKEKKEERMEQAENIIERKEILL